MIGEHLLRFDTNKIIVFCDTETQNLCLHPSHNLPWECAMLKVRGKNIIEEYAAYLKWNPPLNVSKDAARITGYDEGKVNRLGKNPEEVCQRTWDWLHEADYIVGHNVLGFDYYVVNGLFNKLGKPTYNFADKIIDTNLLLKGIKLGIPFDGKSSLLEYQYKMYHFIKKGLKTNLTQACKDYEIPVNLEKIHSALYDLELNFQLFKKIIWQVEI